MSLVMRNRILSITRNTIPYVKTLQPIAGSVAGCILMQQLDYWFERYPNGFFKFLAPTDHSRYKPGESWCEELGMTVDEFRTAFDRIGIRYKSKNLYDLSVDKFGGKFYASYIDRRTNLTYYLRNHESLDEALDQLVAKPTTSVPVNGVSPFTANGHIQSTANGQSLFPEIGISDSQQMGNPHLHITETTSSETTQRLQPQPTAGTPPGSCSCNHVDLVFPPKLFDEERIQIEQMLGACPPRHRQDVLDELEGAIRRDVIQKGPVPFARSLVMAVKSGTFQPSLGVAVLASRRAAKRQAARVTHAIQPDAIVNNESFRKGETFLMQVRARANQKKNSSEI